MKKPNLVKRSLRVIKNRFSSGCSNIMSENPRYESYSIGKFSYGEPNIIWGGEATCKIGNFCSIASGVTIMLGGEHRPDWVTTYPFNAILAEFHTITGHPATKGDVNIGNDVWIGVNALIMSGVCIGDGAVIGANSVVARDVEPYSIVAGNPARLIRKRFDQATTDALLKLQWWNWDTQKIKENVPLMLSNRISEFIERHTVTSPPKCQSSVSKSELCLIVKESS